MKCRFNWSAKLALGKFSVEEIKESPHLNLLVVTENQFSATDFYSFHIFFHHEHLGRDLFSWTVVLENVGAILVDIFENFSEKLSK